MTTKNLAFTSLNHRFNTHWPDETPTTPERLHDCINPALERAAAITYLLQVALELNRANPLSISWYAAQAIRFEVLDAQAMLSAYVGSASTTPEASQPDEGE